MNRPGVMQGGGGGEPLVARVTAALHLDAMVLADEAKSYFEGYGRAERDALPPLLQAAFSVEALRTTTRLMHVISWVLEMRGMQRSGGGATAEPPGSEIASDEAALAMLPEDARGVVARSVALHGRVIRLDRCMRSGCPVAAPLVPLQALSDAFPG